MFQVCERGWREDRFRASRGSFEIGVDADPISGRERLSRVGRPPLRSSGWNNGGAPFSVRPVRCPTPSTIPSSNRSAAAYGSRRWSATSSRTLVRRRGDAPGRNRRSQPLRDDRQDLRLGASEPGRRRLPRPPDARWRSSAARSSGTPAPVAAVVIRTSGRLGRGRSRVVAGSSARRGSHQHRPQLGRRPLCARLVALVDDDQVGDLEQAGLDRLDLVAHLGRLEHDRRVGSGRDLDLALAGPDRLDQDQVETGGVQHRRGRRGRRGQPSGVAARCHRADEHAVIAGVRLHPDPVAEQRAAGDRARRIDRDDRHGAAARPDLGDQRRDKRGLA